MEGMLDTMDTCELFLNGKEPAVVTRVCWEQQGFDFNVASYLTTELPPPKLVTSVRAIVMLGKRIVVLENEDERHFLPGGRIEPQETYEETIEREVFEECGLEIRSKTLLGFLHFRHLKAKPNG